MSRLLLVALLCASAASLAAQDSRSVFRAGADAVTVNVSVKSGSNPVRGLIAEDFRLYDNDALQRIETVSIDAVPVDVSIVVDTSGSAFTEFEMVRETVQRMAALLRLGDRFRVLTMGNAVVNAVPWQEAGKADLSAITEVTGQISLVYDAVLVALFHRTAPDRRHLVIALTDGIDQCSLVSRDTLPKAAERSGAVFHWVRVQTQQGAPRLSVPDHAAWAFCRTGSQPLVRNPQVALAEAVQRTGGTVHPVWYGADAVAERAFDRVFDDFRRSYVLHYVPQNVARTGWHRLRVEMAKGGYAVRARPGYWGSEGVSGTELRALPRPADGK